MRLKRSLEGIKNMPSYKLFRICVTSQPSEYTDLTGMELELRRFMESGYRHATFVSVSPAETEGHAEHSFIEKYEHLTEDDPYFWAKKSAYKYGWMAATVGVPADES